MRLKDDIRTTEDANTLETMRDMSQRYCDTALRMFHTEGANLARYDRIRVAGQHGTMVRATTALTLESSIRRRLHD